VLGVKLNSLLLAQLIRAWIFVCFKCCA